MDWPCFHSVNSYWKWESSKLFPFWSTWDFCSCRTQLWTPVLSFNRCAAPAKLSTWLCFPRMTLRVMVFHVFLFFVCLFSLNSIYWAVILAALLSRRSAKTRPQKRTKNIEMRKLHIAFGRPIVKRTILKLFFAWWSGPGEGCFCSKLSPGSWSPLF